LRQGTDVAKLGHEEANMLTRIDRVQLAVPDRGAAAQGWLNLLGAEPAGEDAVVGLAALRSRYRLGDGFIELLEPDGSGPLAEAVGQRGAHLFAAGAATSDLPALRERLQRCGAEFLDECGQLHLAAGCTGDRGLRVVVSEDDTLPPVEAIDGFYEVTNLVADAQAAVRDCADLFALDVEPFVPISSTHYGYAGTLTRFHPDRLHRFEIITPHVPQNTMGRYFGRFGDSLYMAFAESDELAAIEARAAADGVGYTAVPRATDRKGEGADTVFLHPGALGGMMLGISRRTYAWTWSGHPERVKEQA
jgi:hypothetical protein